MTTLLNHREARTTTTTAAGEVSTPAQRLRATMAAVRVAFRWMGTQKSLASEQKTRAAEAFEAEGQFLSAAKKLLYTRHPAFLAVTAVCGKIDSYVKGLSLPFLEPGVRLIRQHKVDDFSARLVEYRVELEDAVANLDRHYAELKAALQSGRRVPLVGHGPRGSVRRARDGRPPRRRPRPGRRRPHRRLGCAEVRLYRA